MFYPNVSNFYTDISVKSVTFCNSAGRDQALLESNF